MSEISAQKIQVLGGLFEQDTVFKIPPFQRSYTWDEDLIQELWNDIQENVIGPDAAREHFMGVFIFAQEDDSKLNNSGLNQEIVIDGQQRMTTLTILLRAMYDSLANPDSHLAGSIFELIIGGKYNESEFERLILGVDVQEFFAKYIQEKNSKKYRESRKGKRAVEKRIKKAHDFFYREIEHLARVREQKKEDFVDLLFRKMKQKLIAVRIKVQSDADAYTIFETINSKKVELSVSELLKNYLFQQSEKVSEMELKSTRKKWDSIIENLTQETEIEPSQFIRHFWVSNVDSVTEKKLYLAIKNHYKAGKVQIKDLTTDLVDQSLLYSKIALVIADKDDPLIDREALSLLDQIRTLRARQCYPLLLSALSIEVTKPQFKGLLRAIIRVSVLRALNDRNPNELEATYAKSARELRSQGTSVIPSILKDIGLSAPSSAEVKSYQLESESGVSEQLARFILIQYELEKRTGETQLGKVSLEHIMPRTPEDTANWKMTDEEHKKYVGQLGNLALVGNRLNTQASNKPFNEKKKILEGSEIKTTIALAKKYGKWGKAEITKRTAHLCDFALENWK